MLAVNAMTLQQCGVSRPAGPRLILLPVFVKLVRILLCIQLLCDHTNLHNRIRTYCPGVDTAVN